MPYFSPFTLPAMLVNVTRTKGPATLWQLSLLVYDLKTMHSKQYL